MRRFQPGLTLVLLGLLGSKAERPTSCLICHGLDESKCAQGTVEGKGRSPEKSSCSFGFCPIDGGEGPAQSFRPLFTNCIYCVNLGMEREGETTAQIFWHTLAFKKTWYKLSKLGVGGEGLFGQNAKEQLLFFGSPSPISFAAHKISLAAYCELSFHIASLNSYTPKFSGVNQKLT